MKYVKLLDGTWGVEGWGRCPTEGSQLEVVRKDGVVTRVYVLDVVDRGRPGGGYQAALPWRVRAGRSAVVVPVGALVAAIEVARTDLVGHGRGPPPAHVPGGPVTAYVAAVDALLGRLASLLAKP